MKENATVTRRELVKQFVNNLYGTMGSSTETSFNVAYDKGFYAHPDNNKLPGAIYVDTDSIQCDVPIRRNNRS